MAQNDKTLLYRDLDARDVTLRAGWVGEIVVLHSGSVAHIHTYLAHHSALRRPAGRRSTGLEPHNSTVHPHHLQLFARSFWGCETIAEAVGPILS